MTICRGCKAEIKDDMLKNTFYHPDFPDIDIGPYCLECLSKVRVCSVCGFNGTERESFLNNSPDGTVCKTCGENLEICSICDRIIKDDPVTHRGRTYHSECFRKHFTLCSCCDTYKRKERFMGNALTRATYPSLFERLPDLCDKCFVKESADIEPINVAKCKNCSEYYDVDSVDYSEQYCPICWDQLNPCVLCGKKDHNSQSRIFDEFQGEEDSVHTVCSTCQKQVFSCSCRRISLNPKTVKGVFKSHKVCQFCMEEDFGECPNCLHIAPLNSEGICTDCRDCYGHFCDQCGSMLDTNGSCRICTDRQYYSYSFKPLAQFHYTKRDVKRKESLFFGIEHEVTFRRYSDFEAACRYVYKKEEPNMVTLKSDSSIAGDGFEIVTQPMTLDFFHKADLSFLFPPKYEAHPSCGMHVHVTRQAFVSDVHIYKVVSFVHDHVYFVNDIAGRGTNTYNTRLNQKASTNVKNAKDGRADRHLRVNLQNPVTIEFRMFAACKDKFAMRYRIEFVNALVKWTKEEAIKDVSKDRFKEYVEKNKKKYPNLFKFIKNNYS